MSVEAFILKYIPWLSGFGAAIAAHPYIFVFIGLVLGGETILLPAIYLCMTGVLRLSYVTALMVVATVVSDVLWYYAGRGAVPFLTKKELKPRVQKAVTGLSSMFKRNDSYVLFMSKFIYGTRIAAQVLCGMHRMPMRKYLAVNTAGVMALMAVYTFVVYTALETADAVGELSMGVAKYRVHITFAAIILVLLAFQLIIKYFFKKWSR
jgi:membrane protein DedA with SNARE-associated domain